MSFPDEEHKTVADVVGKRAIKKKIKNATGRKMSAADALAEAKKKPRLRVLTRDVVRYLSTSVVAISSLLDPEAIVFGGGTSNAGEAMLERVRKRVAPHLAVRPRLVLAKLGSESQLDGALSGAPRGAMRLPRRQLSALIGRKSRYAMEGSA